MAAWESPTRATVVDDVGAPDAHSSWPTYSQDRTQPLTNTSGLLNGASDSEGVRFEGTAWISADAATAAWTWAVRSRTAASCGSTVGVLGAAAAAIVGLAAAAPWPTGTGTTVSSTRPAATPAAVTLPPSRRLRPADRRSGAANRMGVSTSRPPSPSGRSRRGAARSSTGQCHRYHEYESRPTARIGGTERRAPALQRDAAQPPPTTRAVPSTGSTAAAPG